MILQRVLIMVAVLYLVWRVLSSRGKRMREHAAGADDFSRFSARSRARRARQRREQAERLLGCENCGTFVPADRILTAGDGKVFCSEACRQEATGKQSHTASGPR